jgi:hypothetical protein
MPINVLNNVTPLEIFNKISYIIYFLYSMRYARITYSEMTKVFLIINF